MSLSPLIWGGWDLQPSFVGLVTRDINLLTLTFLCKVDRRDTCVASSFHPSVCPPTHYPSIHLSTQHS